MAEICKVINQLPWNDSENDYREQLKWAMTRLFEGEEVL